MFKSHSSRCSRGFTLIEVLVVVAIIALLIAILLPSLSRAREQARTSVCLTQLKQMGNAVLMYTNDNKSYLPGPGHLLLYVGSSKWEFPDFAPQPTGKLWARLNIPYMIGRYMGDRKAANQDKVGVCPTSERMVKQPAASEWYYKLPSYYVANTGANGGGNAFSDDNVTQIYNGTQGGTPNVRGRKPYYATKVPNYFGYIHLNPSKLESLAFEPGSMPKKIDKIQNQSREWQIADLWSWEVSYPRSPRKPAGTWPFSESTPPDGAANTGALARGERMSYPFHLSSGQFHNNLSDASTADLDPDSSRLSSGLTNAVYFDGHGQSVRKWEGTVNPCFPTANGGCE